MARDATKTALQLQPHQIILRPLVTEKGMHKASRCNAYAFEVNRLAGKDDVRRAVEAVVRRESGAGEHPEPQGQAAAVALPQRNHQGLEKGHRDVGPGTPDQLLLRWSVGRDDRTERADIHGHSQIQSDHAGPPRRDRERLRRADARGQAGEEPAAAEAAQGRAEQPGQDHRPASRRRPQAAITG